MLSLVLRAGALAGALAVVVSPLAGQTGPRFDWPSYGVLPTDPPPTGSPLAADLDGDGDDDLVVVGDAAGQSFEVLRNDGGQLVRAFRAPPPVSPATGSFPLGLVDVDADQDVDFLVLSGTESQLWRNDGGFTFTLAPSGTLPLLFPPILPDRSAVAVADVDGDLDPDLVLGTVAGVVLWINDGSGTFVERATAITGPSAVVVVDFDSDGDPDIVRGDSAVMTEYTSWANDGTGDFGSASVAAVTTPTRCTPVFVAELDGNGIIDVFCRDTDFSTTTLGYALNVGTGGTFFARPVRGIGQRLLGETALDLDGDGRSELALSTEAGLEFPLGGATLVPRIEVQASDLATFDLDGDGDLDLVGRGFGSALRVWRNDENLRLEPMQPPQRTLGDVDVLLGEFVPGRAGGADMLLTNRFVAPLRVGDPDVDLDRGFRYTLPVQEGEEIERRFVADFDLDGDDDALVVEVEDLFGSRIPTLFLWTSQGDGSFRRRLVFRTGFVEPVDLDGDLDLDLVLSDRSTLLVYENRGGVFVDVTTAWNPTVPGFPVAHGDFDGDGDEDVLLRDPNQVLWNTNGRLVAAAPGTVPSDPPGAIAAAGDLDGDRDLDVAFDSALWRNDGGVFVDVSANLPASSRFGTSLALVDLDEDRDLDLVVARELFQSRSVQLFRNDGLGRFADVTALWFPFDSSSSIRDVGVGDLDADGDLDLVVARLGATEVYANMQRHLHATTPLRTGALWQLRLRSLARERDRVAWGVLSLRRDVPGSLPMVRGVSVLDLGLAAAFPPQPMPRGLDAVDWAIPVPAEPTLVGRLLYVQGFVDDSVGNATGFTNLVTQTVGN